MFTAAYMYIHCSVMNQVKLLSCLSGTVYLYSLQNECWTPLLNIMIYRIHSSCLL